MHELTKILRCARGPIFLVLSLSGLGCGPLGVSPMQFIVGVDSISAPDAIAPTETLTVRFWGKVGPDRCSRLDRVEKGRGAGIFEIRFHGERREGGECPHMPASLEHEEKILPPMQDPFTIRVLQPDGTPLVKSVRIR